MKILFAQELLADDAIYITLTDNFNAYLKVLLSKVNFVSNGNYTWVTKNTYLVLHSCINNL